MSELPDDRPPPHPARFARAMDWKVDALLAAARQRHDPVNLTAYAASAYAGLRQCSPSQRWALIEAYEATQTAAATATRTAAAQDAAITARFAMAEHSPFRR